MKVLWIVNIIFPYPAMKMGMSFNFSGGWLYSLADELNKNNNIELAIGTVYSGKKILEFKNDGITYYLLPRSTCFEI